jgi:hypothetical protein
MSSIEVVDITKDFVKHHKENPNVCFGEDGKEYQNDYDRHIAEMDECFNNGKIEGQSVDNICQKIEEDKYDCDELSKIYRILMTKPFNRSLQTLNDHKFYITYECIINEHKRRIKIAKLKSKMKRVEKQKEKGLTPLSKSDLVIGKIYKIISDNNKNYGNAKLLKINRTRCIMKIENGGESSVPITMIYDL